MGGVVSNRVIFHLSGELMFGVVNAENHWLTDDTSSLESDSGRNSFSDDTDILLRLTVSARDIKVMAKVALSSGSSQQGNARLAAVGWHKTKNKAIRRNLSEQYVPQTASKHNTSAFLHVPSWIYNILAC